MTTKFNFSWTLFNAKFSDLHVLSYNKSALNNDTLRSIKAVGSLEFIAL